MKAFIILALVAAAAADVSHLRGQVRGPEADATVVLQDAVVDSNGYKNEYITSNGIQAQETGQLKNPGQKDESLSVSGQAQWTAPDGTPMHITYTADENGYRPQGVHLPTPPPVPAAIARAIAYIAAHPPQPESQAPQRRF